MTYIRRLTRALCQAWRRTSARKSCCTRRGSSTPCASCSIRWSPYFWLPGLILLLSAPIQIALAAQPAKTSTSKSQMLPGSSGDMAQANRPGSDQDLITEDRPQAQISAGLAQLLGGIPPDEIPSGILHDRVLSLAGMERFDGSPDSPAMTLAEWKQIYFELYRASLQRPDWPSPAELRAAERMAGRGLPPSQSPGRLAPGSRDGEGESPGPVWQDGSARPAWLASSGRPSAIPLALLNCEYQEIRNGALEDGSLDSRGGRLSMGTGNPFETRRAVAAAPLRDRTYRGGEVRFVLDPDLYFSNLNRPLPRVEADLDDGLGYREMKWGVSETARYGGAGDKTLRLRLAYGDGSVAHTSTLFQVLRLDAPAPDDTLQITAAIPYNGSYGSGDAYVYLAEGHTSVTQPVILLEGFDLDNSYNWDELYELLNRENFIENLRADGFDSVVLNFTDATDYIQKHAFTAVELIQEIEAMVDPGVTVAVAGASMGGLVARYALSYMETNSLPLSVRTYISFDAPHMGADIPLGLQYWIWFFADQSEEAAAFLTALNSPAARQLLVYHFTDPPGATGQPDPLRGEFLADLAAAGDYPASMRMVAASNGSGGMLDQGFGPASQLIQWEYSSFLVDITGNVWSVPDGTSQRIFEGLIDFILIPADEIDVVVSGTDPYDGAPGGWRDSMAELDAVDPGYGDIVALHPNHCFIPTISSLALDTEDLFYDVAGDSNLLALTPFDDVYFPPMNEEHVDINAQNAPWLLDQVLQGATAIGPPVVTAEPGLFLAPPAPNPFRGATQLRFHLAGAGETQITVHRPSGRQVAALDLGRLDPGFHEVDWNGRGADGREIAPGVYFLRLKAGDSRTSRKVVIR